MECGKAAVPLNWLSVCSSTVPLLVCGLGGVSKQTAGKVRSVVHPGVAKQAEMAVGSMQVRLSLVEVI